VSNKGIVQDSTGLKIVVVAATTGSSFIRVIVELPWTMLSSNVVEYATPNTPMVNTPGAQSSSGVQLKAPTQGLAARINTTSFAAVVDAQVKLVHVAFAPEREHTGKPRRDT
jgi:hypothetical protein